MPRYASLDKIKSGVPLGGIGAGKLEIFPDGTLDFFTFQNNWSKPLTNPKEREGVLGFHFGIFCHTKNSKVGRILQTMPLADYPCVKKIDYDGLFPFAKLKYTDPKLPVKVSLDAFSPFIPTEAKKSGTPGCIFLFKIKNTSKGPVDASLLVSGRNIIGEWSVGRYNEVHENNGLLSVSFKSKSCLPNDFSCGELSISVPKNIGKASYLGEWNMQTKCFFFNREHINLEAFERLLKEEELPNINTKEDTRGESVQLGGALAVKVSLRPGEEAEIPVIYSWHFPQHTVGHVYENWFKSAGDTAKFLFASKDKLFNATSGWQKKILSLDIPGYVSDILINNLHTYFTSSWWGKDYSFVMSEAPIECPLMGTVDVRYYGSLPLAYFFPELELIELMQFVNVQRPNGYIPHDLGYKRIDLPNDGTTFFYWKDLTPKFVLMAYRDYLWSGDIGFLKDIYPALKRAMDWEFSQDRDSDYLPDNEGQDQTFDVWEFYGANAYTSSIFLASLLALEKMAEIMRDKQTREMARFWFENGSKSFEAKLWNGNYFINYSDVKKGKNTACTIGQLNGQWYAHLLGLGYIVDPKKVKKAVKSIISLNGKASKYGIVNSCLPNGKIDASNVHSQNIWPGEAWAFCSLAIYEGYKKEAFEIIRKIWGHFTKGVKNPWNQPDNIDSSTGEYIFGDHYMRNTSIWGILFALSKKDKKIDKALKDIKKGVF